MTNPFISRGYYSKDLFCDRKTELNMLLEYVENGADITFVSPRRIGKTGLIHRLFDEIKENSMPFDTYYVDIYSSTSVADFNRLFSEAVCTNAKRETSFVKKFFRILANVHPVLSFDVLTGAPQIELSYQNPHEQIDTLKNILTFLENQPNKVLVAIDEFQQICDYDIPNMEAILRTHIQQLKNVQFIFCGSKRHVMMDMFMSAKRPFFSSTRFMYLNKLDRQVYAEFIRDLFKNHGKNIDDDALDFVLDYTEVHTFYTQTLCQSLYSATKHTATLTMAKECASAIIKANEQIYLQYRTMLTAQQWKYLRAVAKEGVIERPTSAEFVNKYSIGTASNSRRLLKTLVDKELILENITADRTTYQVYDIFFGKYLSTL